MPGFGDTAVIALIALLLFGPKKLPVLARQLGKLMAEFRRASNEFRSQMEEELRIAEQADRQKEVAALEAASANKIAPPTPAEPEAAAPTPVRDLASPEESDRITDPHTVPVAEAPTETQGSTQPTPIAISGELNMMPPETGLPLARNNGASTSNDALPVAENLSATPASAHEAELETEPLHG
jgi:sec-independent protein translocase protein TatB